MSRWGAEPILDSYGLVALIAAALVALLLVRPKFGQVSRRGWLCLLALRLAAIALVTLALVRPTWVTTLRTPRTSVLVLLLDASRSMQLPSGRQQESRWQAQTAALAKSRGPLAAWANQGELRVYAYDSRLKQLDSPDGTIPLPAIPSGDQTDIGTSLSEALRPEQGKRLAGVVLLGDGAVTAFEPQVETQEAARQVRDDFAAPLFTVTFGPAGDAAQARDVAVERLDEQYTVFVKNELVVRALIRIRGYVKQELPVELTLENSAGEKTLLGKQRVRADEDGKQVEVEFAFTPQEVGRYRLVLSAEPQPGELVVKNNRLDAYLTVLEGGLRVLYLDGEKRFEQKFVRRALNASPDIELDDRIIDRRTQGSWPIDLGRDLTDGKYDVFLLGDLDAQALGPANLTALAAAVGKGKGLAMIGGRASFGRGHYLGTPLGNVLPIEINPLEGANFTTREAEDEFFLPGPLPMIPTGSHPITRLASDAENAAVWRALPPLAWANKFLRTKANMPGLKVLLESSAGQPLLVSGEFGQGRVAGFAGESTYLWPLHGHEREHKRFWRQLVLWLARRDDLERNDVWIKLDQRRVNPGTKIQITAGARTAAGDPLTDVQFSTRLIHPDGRQEPLRLASDGTHFAGQVTPRAPGDYAIETVASAGGRQIGTARAEFLVFDRDVELSNPAADPDLMASLAAWTKAEGGRAVAAEELPALLQSLVDQPPEYEVRELRWKLAGTALDAWVFFLTLTSVLAVEWWLRKKWGLV